MPKTSFIDPGQSTVEGGESQVIDKIIFHQESRMAGWLDTFQGFHCWKSLAALLNVSTARAKDCLLQLKLH